MARPAPATIVAGGAARRQPVVPAAACGVSSGATATGGAGRTSSSAGDAHALGGRIRNRRGIAAGATSGARPRVTRAETRSAGVGVVAAAATTAGRPVPPVDVDDDAGKGCTA